jgi:biopolymer transport protein ExbD
MSAIQSDNGQDFDLNLAPIIDCFTVLITYLLVSASFISLVVLDVGVAAVGPADSGKPVAIPPYNLMVELDAKRTVTLKVTGGPTNLDLKIPVLATASQDWDTEAVKREISGLEKKYPKSFSFGLNTYYA